MLYSSGFKFFHRKNLPRRPDFIEPRMSENITSADGFKIYELSGLELELADIANNAGLSLD